MKSNGTPPAYSSGSLRGLMAPRGASVGGLMGSIGRAVAAPVMQQQQPPVSPMPQMRPGPGGPVGGAAPPMRMARLMRMDQR